MTKRVEHPCHLKKSSNEAVASIVPIDAGGVDDDATMTTTASTMIPWPLRALFLLHVVLPKYLPHVRGWQTRPPLPQLERLVLAAPRGDDSVPIRPVRW
jgi:hypothetical protein